MKHWHLKSENLNRYSLEEFIGHPGGNICWNFLEILLELLRIT